MRTAVAVLLVAALGGVNALGGLFGGRPSRAQQSEARAAFRENMPESCHEHFDEVEECVKARYGDENERQNKAFAMMGQVRGCANEGGCSQFALFRIIMSAKSDADSGKPVELPRCVAEGLNGQTPREYMADCLDRDAKPESGKLLMMKHLWSRRDELRSQCTNPDGFKSCMKRMINSRKSEICDSPCMKEPPRQCKNDLAEMRREVCACATQMKNELRDTCSAEITDEMRKHAAGKMARCDRPPREWSDGKPAMCHEDLDDDDDSATLDDETLNAPAPATATRRCNRACQRRRQRQRAQGRK